MELATYTGKVSDRVYAKTKKKKTLEELEILPICSKKRVCEKIDLEEILEIYVLTWLSNYNSIFFYDSTEIAS